MPRHRRFASPPFTDSGKFRLWLKPRCRKMVKYCSACWRKEKHRLIRPPSFLYGAMLVGTLGIAWFFRPKQCLCCGKTRLI